jgi:hypothetical protein
MLWTNGISGLAASLAVGAFANVKVQDSVSSRSSSAAQIIERSGKGIMLRLQRYLAVGTVVQLNVAGDISVWKVFCCIPGRNSFHAGLEPALGLPKP